MILWNNRWEYDKNPDDFFKVLDILAEKGLDFKVVVLGENFKRNPDVFERAREKHGNRILQFGYVESRNEYLQWLFSSDILPVTSNQDFFGLSVVEPEILTALISNPKLIRNLEFKEHLKKFNWEIKAK